MTMSSKNTMLGSQRNKTQSRTEQVNEIIQSRSARRTLPNFESPKPSKILELKQNPKLNSLLNNDDLTDLDSKIGVVTREL